MTTTPPGPAPSPRRRPRPTRPDLGIVPGMDDGLDDLDYTDERDEIDETDESTDKATQPWKVWAVAIAFLVGAWLMLLIPSGNLKLMLFILLLVVTVVTPFAVLKYIDAENADHARNALEEGEES